MVAAWWLLIDAMFTVNHARDPGRGSRRAGTPNPYVRVPPTRRTLAPETCAPHYQRTLARGIGGHQLAEGAPSGCLPPARCCGGRTLTRPRRDDDPVRHCLPLRPLSTHRSHGRPPAAASHCLTAALAAVAPLGPAPDTEALAGDLLEIAALIEAEYPAA